MMPLNAGDKAPEFTLKDAGGIEHRLSEFLGKNVILYFYPKDDTPGCTKEACDFRDHGGEFGKLNAVIVGISRDSEESHGKFLAKYQLPFLLLSDPDLKAIRAYDVWQEKTFLGKTSLGVVRSTFWIDPLGKIKKTYLKVSVLGHVSGVLEDMKKENRA